MERARPAGDSAFLDAPADESHGALFHKSDLSHIFYGAESGDREPDALTQGSRTRPELHAIPGYQQLATEQHPPFALNISCATMLKLQTDWWNPLS